MQNTLPNLLVIGEYYFVPCIPVPEKSLDLWQTVEDGWLPVFSESHIDPEVIAPKNDDSDEDDYEEIEYDGNGDEGLNPVAHYHIDVRFLKLELPIGGSIGIPASVLASQLGLSDSSFDRRAGRKPPHSCVGSSLSRL